MGGFFTRERFGRPQILAALMLLAFLAQCLWLVEQGWRTGTVYPAEIYRLERGTALWKNRGVFVTAPDLETELDPSLPNLQAAPVQPMPVQPGLENSGYDANHSPLWYLIASAPLALSPVSLRPENIRELHRLAAAPYLVFGLLLGASVWYVSRRLFGNAGGYVALALYCFSPGIVRSSAIWSAEPEIGAAWGAFGAIFTAIAVAHTLYAPREVILWNWRRIVLLGVSLAIAVGSQFSMIVVIPLALAFMLYVAPIRRAAALAIWIAAVLLATALLFAVYFFHLHIFYAGLRHASFWGATWRAFTVPGVYRQVGLQLLRACPALALLFPLAIATYLIWSRTSSGASKP